MSYLVNNTSTTSKRSLFPEETNNLWVKAAYGSRLLLSNDTWVDDWVSALGAVTLGYGAIPPYSFIPSVSMPWQVEQRFAEQFCTAMKTEAVRFMKNGSDATNAAVRVARAFTEREHIFVFQECYHGTGDWHGQNLWLKRGIVDDCYPVLHRLNFGCHVCDFDDYPLPAAIILEPVPKSVLLPPDGWLQTIRRWCDEHGVLLIADQMILGYHHTLYGYPGTDEIYYDLSCYGKAMGQGAAIAACTGRADIMNLLEKEVHYSGTNFGCPTDLMVAQFTLEQYNQRNVCTLLNDKGRRLKSLLLEAGFLTKGLDTRFEVVFGVEEKESITKYCFDKGILFPGFVSISISQSSEQMYKLVEVLSLWKKEHV